MIDAFRGQYQPLPNLDRFRPPQTTPSFSTHVIKAIAIGTMIFIASAKMETISPPLVKVIRWIGAGIGLICLFYQKVKPPPPGRSDPTPIGQITFSDRTLTFKKEATQITVLVDNHQNNTQTEMLFDEMSYKHVPCDIFSDSQKIHWLTENPHFELICNKYEGVVFFSLINPALLEWEIIQSDTRVADSSSKSFCRLIDETTAYGSSTGVFSIYSIHGTCLFSLNFQKEIQGINEFGNGLLQIETPQSTLILCPKKKVDPSLLAIKTLKQEIKRSPSDFSLYQRLADQYKVMNNPEEFKVYQERIKAAACFHHHYQARRFTEQAAALYPTQKIKFYLTYLSCIIDPAEMRAGSIKLYNLLEKNEEIFSFINRWSLKGYKTRLLIGEGNFTFAEDLIKVHSITHPGLARAIIATELDLATEQSITNRVDSLLKKGVSIFLKVDAQTLHQQFNERIPRIHWNCPNGGGTKALKEQFKGTVVRFFQAGSQLQKCGDRIHITLLQEPDNWKLRQVQCDLVEAATEACYRLIRKRLFHERYPGYQHKKTIGKQSIDSKKREFVFEKVQIRLHSDDLITKAQKLCDPEIKKFKVESQKNNKEKCYFDCSTDDDSSDYYDSD